MIPNKLYIPTSTLNFNNIISSESISPAGFYARRGFGYKRFEKVAPNNLENRIILYEKYPLFEINDSDLENYPMVIEIDTKSINEDIIQNQNNTFFVDETIYINPFSTRILFRNEQEKISTLSKAEPSIETKMVPLYENYIVVKSNDIESFKWTKLEIKDSQTDISSYISNDRRINKLKGFLYAYLIASNKSISADVVSLKKYTKDLRNILAAIISSPNGQATYQQTAQLKLLYKSIYDVVYRAEGLSKKLELIIQQKKETYECFNFIEILRNEKLYDYWLEMQNIRPSFKISTFYVSPTSSDEEKEKIFESYMLQIEKQISSIESNQSKTKIDNSKLPRLQYGKIIHIPDQKEFIIKLFNEYLEEAYNSEEFIQSRYEFAKSGGKIFKEEIQDKWDGSPWQKYINDLLKNLNEYSSFNIKSANNLTLESFAAFCQKGESDIDKLEDYLISNEIGDFRIAFGLWGIIFGFSNMPKTLTNELFLTDDLAYVADVYKYIYKQIHGLVLDGNLEKKKIKSMVQEQPLESYPISTKTMLEVQNNSEIQDIKIKLSDCKLKPEQLSSIYEIYQKNQSKINKKFFVDIKKVKGIGDKTVERILLALGDVHTPKKTLLSQNPILFGAGKPILGKEFYKDSNIWIYIDELLPNDKRIRKQVKEDFDWFQGNHFEFYMDKKKGQQKGIYSDKQKDNNTTIDRFNKYLENKLNGSQSWLSDIYSQIDIEKIISRVKTLYLKDDR